MTALLKHSIRPPNDIVLRAIIQKLFGDIICPCPKFTIFNSNKGSFPVPRSD